MMFKLLQFKFRIVALRLIVITELKKLTTSFGTFLRFCSVALSLVIINMEKNTDKEVVESERIEELQSRIDQNRSWTGCLFGFSAAMMISFAALILKITDEHKVLITLTRLMFQYIMLMPIIQYKRVDVLGATRKLTLLLLLVGFLGPIVAICLALALNYLSLGDTDAIFYTNPAFTMLFACICLGGEV